MPAADATSVSVDAHSPADGALAADVASRLGYPQSDPNAQFVLMVGTSGWELHDRTSRQRPLRLDFAELLRQRGAATARSPLGRASGIRQTQPKSVLDCTAGLGRDGFMLGSLGASRVQLIERDPVVAALLEDALRRARADGAVPRWVESVSVARADARDWLARRPFAFDVVYIDPMFPAGRRALAGRELQFLQRLLPSDRPSDGEELIGAALETGCARVIAKRAKHQPAIDRPTFAVPGRSFRFDVYVNADARA